MSEPFPPQNLSLSHVSSSTARVTWDRHPRSIPDGFVVNVSRGLTTRSRYLPDGTLSMYTIRELSPGQHYRLALTAVRNTGHEQIHSVAQHLAFTTCETQELATLYVPAVYRNWHTYWHTWKTEDGETATVGALSKTSKSSYICLDWILPNI